jgi:tryptophanyl-tRNA synthetase
MTEITSNQSRPRVLSGMRPTGRLHLGNYMGALYNWVQLQDQYNCFFFIADFHALTTDYADPSRLKQNVYEVALDFLSAGLDPQRCTIFVQSHVPQHAELHLLLSMITPVSWLERVPTYKDQQEQLREKDLATYGFLGYPLLQAADILVYQPNFVPVGQDQVAHVELTREVARRFNHFYSPKRVVPGVGGSSASTQTEPDPDRLLLPEPEVLLTPSPKLPGTDGRKMSKSYNNSILLSDIPADVTRKMLSMSNGGQRPTQSDPGDPEICPVGDMHRVFSPVDVDQHIRKGCREASIRCDECKLLAASSINIHLEPIRRRRETWESNPDRIWDTLADGAARARTRAEQTMQSLRAATGLSQDRSGVRVSAMANAREQNNSRNLSTYKAWWNIEPALLNRNLQELWRSQLLPTEARVRPDSDSVYVTSGGKRILVTAACESGDNGGSWMFFAKPKSYELLVLLCWGADMQLRDFVVPQKLYVARWTAYKKAHKDEVIPLWVTRQGEESFTLNFDDSEPPISLDGLQAQYAPLQ